MSESQSEPTLAEQMASLKKLMEDCVAQSQAFQIIRDEHGSKVADLNLEINRLRQVDKEIQTKQFDIQREMKRAESSVQSIERQLAQVAENAKVAAELSSLNSEYDRTTENAFWREAAMPHQIIGGKSLATAKRAILGDKRGLGKTLTSLIAADMLGAKKIIYVSPGDVIKTVEREIHHWAPNRDIAPLGMMPKAQRKFVLSILAKQPQFVITINYEAWRRDRALLDDIASLQCDTIIIDESHNIKDIKSVNYKGVEHIIFATNSCPSCRELNVPHTVSMEKSSILSWMSVPTCSNGHASDRAEAFDWCSVQNVFPMTGTPILNKPEDLFAPLSLIDRKNFSNRYTFMNDYCQQDYITGKWGFRSGGLDSLTRKLAGKFLVRDRKSAGVVLPKQEEVIYELTLDPAEYPEQYRYAKQLNEYAVLMLDEDKHMNIIAMIALITRKRQMMTWPAGIKFTDPQTKEVIATVDCDESIKIDRCIEPVDVSRKEMANATMWAGLIPELTADGDMNEGERVVLFSQFKTPLIELERRLKLAGISVVRYDGDTSRLVRDQVALDFDRKYCNEPGYVKKWQVALCHYKTGGVGLNLTDATQTIILDEEWNPGKKDQAYGRTDRMGQTEETTVHVLRVKGSVDTWMNALNEEKAAMIDGFENAQALSQTILDAIKNGDMI